MNKLFIIGNGFDLSLGLKTKYENFLFWLVKREIKNVFEGIGRNHSFTSKNELFSVQLESGFKSAEVLIGGISDLKTLQSRIRDYKNYVSININNPEGLFQKIYTQSSKKWVDIEFEYYNLLKFHCNTISTVIEKWNPRNSERYESSVDLNKSHIQRLNSELKALGQYLVEYLKEVSVQSISPIVIQKHQEKFSSDAEITYFLNFNYTNTLKGVLNGFQGKHHINHIHGSIENDIIFGYGDEMDKNYKIIEDLNENLFFEHIKSFSYFKQDNYTNLLGFLSSGNFEVCIYGHSCGLSDRVMLKEIFENDNCASIRVYHYNEAEYTTKTMDISRHFDSNSLMRKRVINFSAVDGVPQFRDV